MKESRGGGFTAAVTLLVGCLALGWSPATAQSNLVPTGTGTNRCLLILNFPAGEKVVFEHRWNGSTLNAQTLLESVVTETGGELVITEGYLTPFEPATLTMTNPVSSGLVVHYQGSSSAPYLNAIRWHGPDGPSGADYQFPDNWWHLWVQGPARVDQSFAWPDPLPPVDLAFGSAWFLGEFSGLADLTLSDGAAIGLVYGSADQPSLPAPAIRSVLASSGNTLQIQFTSVPGASYQLETRSDLAGGTWVSLGNPIVATASATTISTPANPPAGRAFYRLGLLP